MANNKIVICLMFKMKILFRIGAWVYLCFRIQ